MSKIDQINEIIHRELAMAVNQELQLPNVLVTISYVFCDQDLRSARVGVSVLPDKLTGTALKRLKASSGIFAKIIAKNTRLRKAPKLIWEFDDTERKAAELEEVFLKIDEDVLK